MIYIQHNIIVSMGRGGEGERVIEKRERGEVGARGKKGGVNEQGVREGWEGVEGREGEGRTERGGRWG